jgi:3-methyl-2-oxobutanoate hydroxymethyltransferase
MILVGDSVANTVLGYDDTLAVDLNVMIHHTAAVARTEPNALVVGDMPWMSYHLSVDDAVRNAGRLVREGGAEAVKLEGGRKRVPVVEAILSAEIPVMGHLGLTPQSVHAMGGYRVQGKAADAAKELLADAHQLADAGVFALVLEGIPDVLAQLITKEVSVPTIGIGAGRHTDGQVLVFHDVLGMHNGRVPKFVRKYANLFEDAVEALQAYVTDVQSGAFPGDEESYHMTEDAAKSLFKEEPRDDLSWPLSW